VVADLQEQLGNPKALDALRADVEREAGRLAEEVAARRGALNRQAKELDGRIRDGSARLLSVPADLMDEAAAALRALKEQRTRLAEDLAALAKQEEAAAQRDERIVQKALGLLGRLPKLMEQGKIDPRELRTVLQGLVQQVDVFFRPSSQKKHNRCADLDRLKITLSPLLADLVSTACGTRSAGACWPPGCW
jgi:hypothetical protein